MAKKSITENKTIQRVLDHKVCCGCGSCSVICPTSCITMVYGKRFNYPKIDEQNCTNCGKCLKVCPSEFLLRGSDPGYSRFTKKENLKSYLIYSSDDNIRIDASSGGFITGIILHLMKMGLADGAVVAKSQGQEPWIAKSIVATSKQELLDSRASKYAPVSNCAALKYVLEKPGRYVFVGTPCMVEGLRKLQKYNPVLKERIVLAIGFVCAGMASRLSTRAFLKRFQVDFNETYKISYRGGGWPGYFRVFNKEGEVILEKTLLGCSLDLLVGGDHYLRCHNCLDPWSNFADIIVSDPWSDDMVDGETKGWSGIMIRTKAGQDYVDSAISEGDLIAREVTSEEMYSYNTHLIITKDHSRHSWMAVYQLLFFRRLNGLLSVFISFFKKQGIGLRTTLRARLDHNYYENEAPMNRLLEAETGPTEHLRVRSEIAHKKAQDHHSKHEDSP